MRYRAGHKAGTRRRIVEATAWALRARGLAGVGVADLMREAGLTHGGFYSHFDSKDTLVAEAVGLAGEESARNLHRIIDRAGRRSAWADIVAAYLSPAHRDRPDRGCALAALGPELARESAGARRAIAAQLETLLDLLAEHVPARRGTSRRREAMVRLAGLVGALILSRIAGDRALSDAILASARHRLSTP